jgi:inner membrane protein involved in colicin E2 resistance
MKAAGRIFWTVFWLGALAIVGFVILSMAAARVGEQRSSTYGQAYAQFQNSWGGEIGIVPPTFALERTYTVRRYNEAAKQYELEERTEQLPLIPHAIVIDSTVDYGEQKLSLLSFNAFEARCQETYRIQNRTGYSGKLLLSVTKPDQANLLYDYQVRMPGRDGDVVRPVIGQSLVLLSEWRPGDEVEVVVSYATKGMDLFKYNLSAYEKQVIGRLEAQIRLNTKDFQIYRFGLPHTLETTPEGATLRFAMNDFSTTQDLGIAFTSRQMYLDHIQNLMRYSPVSLLLYLVVILVFTQVRGVRFNPLHYLFLAAIDVFYFLFVAYLIRFLNLGLTFALAIGLTAAMFLAYAPNVVGWRFATRVMGPYLFVLTVVFSLIFVMPIFRGLLFVTLVFLVFLSVMVVVSRSNISEWQLVRGGPLEPQKEQELTERS